MIVLMMGRSLICNDYFLFDGKTLKYGIFSICNMEDVLGGIVNIVYIFRM